MGIAIPETQGRQPSLPLQPPPVLLSHVSNAPEKGFLLGKLFQKHQQLLGLNLVSTEEQLYTSQFISTSERSGFPGSLL